MLVGGVYPVRVTAAAETTLNSSSLTVTVPALVVTIMANFFVPVESVPNLTSPFSLLRD